jgi:hypothetical protein
MALVLNGSANTIGGLAVGGLPNSVVDTDMIATEAVTSPKIGNGGIIQVKSAVKTGYQSWYNTTLYSFSDITDLSITITPTSASNTILIAYQISGTGTNNSYAAIKCIYNVDGGSFSDTVKADALTCTNGNVCIRASTTLDTEDSYGLYKLKTRGVQFMHSPGSTGTLIYKLQLAQLYDSANKYTWVNRCTDIGNMPRAIGVSTFQVMEVVA